MRLLPPLLGAGLPNPPAFPTIDHEALPMHTIAPPRPQMPDRSNAARHSVVVPMPFPDPADVAREHAARMRHEQAREAMRLANAERQAAALRAAGQAGRDQGYRCGYVDGWHWGLTCGAVTGLVCGAGAVIFLQWLRAFAASLS